MIKNNLNVLLIVSIGFMAVVSGCIAGQNSKVSETAKLIPTAQLTEAKYLEDCITTPYTDKYGNYISDTQNTTPCNLVSIEFINHNEESNIFSLDGVSIVTKDGRQLYTINEMGIVDEVNGRVISVVKNKEVCNQNTFFKLIPGEYQNVTICYPLVRKEDNPILYMKVRNNNNEQKEFIFDLTSYQIPIIIK